MQPVDEELNAINCFGIKKSFSTYICGTLVFNAFYCSPSDNNVTMDDMEEADETLIRLWRQGQEDFKELRRRLEETGSKGTPLRPR